jgi:urea transport system permease protein
MAIGIWGHRGNAGLRRLVRVLRAAADGLGLAIIFGQMGVINMAHEFMTIGAYTIYVFQLTAHASFQPYYFFFAIALSFLVAFAVGWLVEWAMISRLYKRPLDTLLATWGLSLVMQQTFRSVFGAREVSAEPPAWLMGSVNFTDAIEIPRNGLFMMALTVLLTAAIFLMLYRSRWGLQVRHRAEPLDGRAVGINTRKVDRMTFAIGCGIAGVAGAAFTTIGSTGPTAGSQYIVDTFLVVVFGGAQSLLGTIASAFGSPRPSRCRSFSSVARWPRC